MAKQNTSAGILLYRRNTNGIPEYLLVHPGGPYNQYKDKGAWSIPKGEYEPGESPWCAAKREFEEELGTALKCTEKVIDLHPVKQKGGKTVRAFACEGDIDCDNVKSNVIPFEYPYRSGKFIDVPEVDKAAWFSAAVAKEKINPAQVALINELEGLIFADTLAR